MELKSGHVNLNKLFPRLSIRAKLAIAFVLIAAVPLTAVAAVAIRFQLDHLRNTAEEHLDHDLRTARLQMEDALREAEESVAYMAGSVLEPTLEAPGREQLKAAGEQLEPFLRKKPAFHRVSLIDEDGRLLLVARATGSETIHQDPRRDIQPSGRLYAHRARAMEPEGHFLLPVEVEGAGGRASEPVAAVAVVKPFWDESGNFRGAVAGEVYAPDLFAGLEPESASLPGITGLVDRDGFYLYHSERKRDWATLLAAREDVDLSAEFSPEVASDITRGEAGTTAAEGRIVKFAPLALGDYGTGPLFLYRAVSANTLEEPVRSFLWWVTVVGTGLGALVLGLAVVAASQFTRPIYRLREGMRRLAEGAETPGPIDVETNDELEDLAEEFTQMARSLGQYRHRLEDLVEDRTRALHETYAELASVLAHSADAIIGLDPEGRVRIWNRGAQELFGYTEHEAVGRDVQALIHPRAGEAEHEAAFLSERLRESGAVVNFRTKRMRKDGDVLPVSLTQSLIHDDEGRVLGSSLILRDARMQTKLEDQMRRSERLAAVSVMATALAHEVKNPLAIIGNRIEVMRREVTSYCPACDLGDHLSVLQEHTGRLSEVTRGLLDLASDKEYRDGGTVDLGAVARRVTRLTEQTFSARDIRLDVRTPEGSPLAINADENALETVCLNLLLNAADVTPAGGAVLLEVRGGKRTGEVELEVRDTGPGIPAELRERIFEPFFSTKGPRGGTGLGLAVCRSVVERHGGTIHVETETGTGSRFIVTLPAHAPVTV